MKQGSPTQASGVQMGTRLLPKRFGSSVYLCPCGVTSYSLHSARIHARSKTCPLVQQFGLSKIQGRQ